MKRPQPRYRLQNQQGKENDETHRSGIGRRRSRGDGVCNGCQQARRFQERRRNLVGLGCACDKRGRDGSNNVRWQGLGIRLRQQGQVNRGGRRCRHGVDRGSLRGRREEIQDGSRQVGQVTLASKIERGRPTPPFPFNRKVFGLPRKKNRVWPNKENRL